LKVVVFKVSRSGSRKAKKLLNGGAEKLFFIATRSKRSSISGTKSRFRRRY